jgi:hypothetical protein
MVPVLFVTIEEQLVPVPPTKMACAGPVVAYPLKLKEQTVITVLPEAATIW